MKLPFDENLSPRLAGVLADIYPDSAHVHDCGLGSADDSAVWQYAKDHGFVVVSKDSDFQERSVLLGSPPGYLASRDQLHERSNRKSVEGRCADSRAVHSR